MASVRRVLSPEMTIKCHMSSPSPLDVGGESFINDNEPAFTNFFIMFLVKNFTSEVEASNNSIVTAERRDCMVLIRLSPRPHPCQPKSTLTRRSFYSISLPHPQQKSMCPGGKIFNIAHINLPAKRAIVEC